MIYSEQDQLSMSEHQRSQDMFTDAYACCFSKIKEKSPHQSHVKLSDRYYGLPKCKSPENCNRKLARCQPDDLSILGLCPTAHSRETFKKSLKLHRSKMHFYANNFHLRRRQTPFH